MSLVPINSKEELQKVLALQRTISDTSVLEVQQHMHLPPKYFVETASKVLELYARYATLTEFQKLPHLADSEKWGATFGVTALVGSLILGQARQTLSVQSDLRFEFMEFLTKLQARGTGQIEMDALMRIFAILCQTYGLVWAQGDSLALTVVGSRVLLHMLDAHQFITEAGEAAAKYQ